MNTRKPKYLGFLVGLDGVLSVLVLALSGYLIDQFYKAMASTRSPMSWAPLITMFLLLAVSQGLMTLRARVSENYIEQLRHTGYCIVFVVCAALVLLRGENAPGAVVSFDTNLKDFHLQAITLLYEAALIASRLLSLWRDRTRTSLIVNLLAIAAIVAGMWGAEIITLIFVIAMQTLAHVSTVAFSRVDMATLKKIIRKTYAAEILAGMVLMIVAISIVLAHAEESIGSYGNAMWYCFAIVTTIGFGDITAVTPLGRFLSVVLGMYGIVVVALLTSIITNYYGETKSDDEDTKKEETA